MLFYVFVSLMFIYDGDIISPTVQRHAGLVNFNVHAGLVNFNVSVSVNGDV